MGKVNYVIRFMREEDIPQVAEIDREAFPGECLFRSYASYKRDLNDPSVHYVVACTKDITEKSNRQAMPTQPWLKWLPGHSYFSKEYVVGFAGFWLMLKEAHITAIATRSNYRRIGIGEALLISTIGLAAQLNVNVLTLEVRASNEVAQELYRKYGFQVVGKHLRYYSDNGEDAVVMNTDTITSASFQAYFQELKEAHSQKQRFHYLSI